MGRRIFKEELENAKEDIFAQTRKGDDQAVDDLFAGFGTDKKYTKDDVDHNGNTVLVIACQFGHRKIARKCLRWGMDIDHENDKAETAVQVAVTNEHEKLAEYLITKKAEVSFFGRTLLHEAAQNGLLGVCQALVLRGINVNEKDTMESTPLHEAVAHGCEEVVGLLLDKGADPTLQNKSMASALHLGAQSGFESLCQKLLAAGADSTLLDVNKKTAWECAQENGHRTLGEVLKQQCEDKKVAKEAAVAKAAEETAAAEAAAVEAPVDDGPEQCAISTVTTTTTDENGVVTVQTETTAAEATSVAMTSEERPVAAEFDAAPATDGTQ